MLLFKGITSAHFLRNSGSRGNENFENFCVLELEVQLNTQHIAMIYDVTKICIRKNSAL